MLQIRTFKFQQFPCFLGAFGEGGRGWVEEAEGRDTRRGPPSNNARKSHNCLIYPPDQALILTSYRARCLKYSHKSNWPTYLQNTNPQVSVVEIRARNARSCRHHGVRHPAWSSFSELSTQPLLYICVARCYACHEIPHLTLFSKLPV